MILKFNQFNKDYLQFLEITNSPIEGMGVFCKCNIPTDTIICQIADISKKDNTDNWINQIGHNINHSSYPTCQVEVNGTKCYLKSITGIESGNELTTDYTKLPEVFNKTIYN